MVSLLIDQNNPLEALKYAERAKGRVLLDVLRNGRINIYGSLSRNEQSEERRLYGEMVSLNTQIRAERMRKQADEARIGDMETRLREARIAYETFQASLYAARPELKAKRGLLPTFTTEDASGLVPDARTAILEYVVTAEQTFLFVLGKDSTNQANVDVKVYSVRIKSSDLSGMVESFRNQLATNNPGYRQTGLELYDLLVRPAEAHLRGKTAVCIVPDGGLWNLPYQALQTSADKYLLELYAVYYAPSLQVLREMRKRSASLLSPPAGKNEQNVVPPMTGAKVGPQLYAIGNPVIDGEAPARPR